MTQTLQGRRPTARTVRPVRPQPPPRPGRKRRLSRGYAILLLAMTYGSTIALLVVTVGFTSLVRSGAAPEGSLALQQAGAGDGHDHGGGGDHGGSRPNIRIEARHLGNLVLDVKAEVTMNQDRDPLIQAEVVAFTDMVQMPNVHTQGPLPLQAAPGKPGLYETTTELSMPGDYEVRIVVQDPVQGEKTTTVPVNATYGTDDTGQGRTTRGREP